MSQKWRARDQARKAVKDGVLKKGPCEVCGETKVEGHHDDYSKPLEVRWLCKLHHNRVDAPKRNAARKGVKAWDVFELFPNMDPEFKQKVKERMARDAKILEDSKAIEDADARRQS